MLGKGDDPPELWVYETSPVPLDEGTLSGEVRALKAQ